jgi:hypothetical protein
MTNPTPAAANDPTPVPTEVEYEETDEEYEEFETMLHDDAVDALDLDITFSPYEAVADLAEETLDAMTLDAPTLGGAVRGAITLQLARGTLSRADATPGTVLRVMTSQSRGPETEALLTSLWTVLEAARSSEAPGVRLAALAVEVFVLDVEGEPVCSCCRERAGGGVGLRVVG